MDRRGSFLLIDAVYLLDESLSSLLLTIQNVSPSLKPLQDELVNLRRRLALLVQKTNGYTAANVNEIQEKLRELDNSKTKLFQAEDPKGKALIEGLFEQLFEEAEDLKASTNSVSESLAPIVGRLKQIKTQLERLALTHKWTLRETDLYTYHVSCLLYEWHGYLEKGKLISI